MANRTRSSLSSRCKGGGDILLDGPAPNPSLPPTRYSRLRRPPRAGEFKC